ncbi:MAG: hypothetical protein JWP52_773 [Rhizobacter sp.]|jgi:FMN-dependent NADH-azoreductase|nr:hypothetical protein [Rhizobacter sp.]
MNILHLSFSPRSEGSHSLAFSQRIVARLVERNPSATVTLRDLSRSLLDHVDEDYAHTLVGAQRPHSPDGSLARSEALIVELEAADAVVIATPMHNYTVPSSFKSWIDHVLRIHRSFTPSPQGDKVGLLKDRPVFIAVASGGLYCGPNARQPDFLTPYLEAVFKTIGLRDLSFFPLQGMVRGGETQASVLRNATALLDERLPPVMAPLMAG